MKKMFWGAGMGLGNLDLSIWKILLSLGVIGNKSQPCHSLQLMLSGQKS